MRQTFFIIVIIMHHTIMTHAQQVTFSKVFSNYPLNPENGWNIQEIPMGYLIVSANECLDQSGDYCSSIILLDFNGNVIWHRNIQQTLGYVASNISIIDDKIFISGRNNSNQTQFSLHCFDLNGNLLLDQKYGNSKREWPAGIVTMDNKEIVLYGNRDRNQNHMYEWLPVLMRISLQGDSLTEFTFNEQYDATSVKQVIESTEQDLIASYVYCPDGCFLDLKGGVICLNSLGDTKWVLDLPYSYSPYGCMVSQIDSNTLAVKWHIDSNLPNHDLTPPAIFFTDMSGVIQDTFVFQNQSLKEVQYMEAVWEKGLVGSGSNYIDSNLDKNAGWVFRMDENRKIVWDRTYLDTTYQGRSFGLNQIIPTSDGGYIATGTITNWMTGVWESHNWILKLDSSGCLQPGCFDKNYITDTEEAVFLKGKDIQVYPNPANAHLNVVLPEDLAFDSSIKIRLVSNMREVVREQFSAGLVTQLDLSLISSGVYYLVVSRDNEIISSKKIVISR